MVVIIVALLPVVWLLFYIYRRDKYQPEPVGQILKAFFMGTLSILISFPMAETLSLYTLDTLPILEKIRMAFFDAAIPEETAKFIMLWLFLRKNPYFDEKMDGIVYAACVSLGFAAVENIMYLFGNYDNWVDVGVVRAVFAVPGHFGFGVLMGYYYSLVRFSSLSPVKNRILLLAAPILAHGVYDSILMTMSAVHYIFVLVLILWFLIFCYKLHVLCRKRISQILKLDEEMMKKSANENVDEDKNKIF